MALTGMTGYVLLEWLAMRLDERERAVELPLETLVQLY